MIQYASRAQLKEKARDQMAGHYGNAILLSICRSLIVFSLSFAVSMPFTMILTVRTLMGGSAETSLTEYLLLTATTTLLSIFTGVFQTGITLFYLNTACSRPVLRLRILIQKIARDLRSTDPAEYGMYTSVWYLLFSPAVREGLWRHNHGNPVHCAYGHRYVYLYSVIPWFIPGLLFTVGFSPV